MTEGEWSACRYPYTMLEYLDKRASDRKLRLLACHCCRQPAVWRLLHSQQAGGRSGRLVEVSERYAEGEATWEDVLVAAEAAPKGHVSGGPWRSMNPVHLSPSSQAQRATLSLAVEDAWQAALGVIREGANLLGSAPCELMRDLFGNPLRPLAAVPGWLTPGATSLAQGIYNERAFDQMPRLADALSEAGCEESAILDHCRSEGLHARGCWVLDLVLGKQ